VLSLSNLAEARHVRCYIYTEDDDTKFNRSSSTIPRVDKEGVVTCCSAGSVGVVGSTVAVSPCLANTERMAPDTAGWSMMSLDEAWAP
jgi:hypothetical protein